MAFHVSLLVAFGAWPRTDAIDLQTNDDPFIVDLQPPEELVAKRLVETGAPSTEPPRDSDLVSAENTQALTPDEVTKDASQAGVADESDFERLATSPPAEPVEATPPPTPEASPEQAASKAVPLEAEPSPDPAEDNPAERPESDSVLVAQAPKPNPQDDTEALDEKEPLEVTPEEKPEPKPVEELPELFEVAAAPPVPPSKEILPNESQGRADKGASAKSPLSFAANQHELAKYMQDVQQRVELVWRSVLRFRYSGTNQATAVLDCSISPSGSLTSVKIADPGNSIIYAALCKEAIEKAAPFSPFPFDVPKMYRSRDLEVSWTFTFK
jgi:hypothetical protein